MVEFLGVSLILFVLIALPIGVIATGIVLNTTVKQFFKLQAARLQLDRERFERDTEFRRLSTELPPWLDITDPVEVSAWRSAMRETTAVAVTPSPHREH